MPDNIQQVALRDFQKYLASKGLNQKKYFNITVKETITNWKGAELQDIYNPPSPKKTVTYRAYPGWVLLQCSQVALQSQAAAVIEQSFHPGHMCFYQLLSLTGCLLLQSLHFFLETLHTNIHVAVTDDTDAIVHVSHLNDYFLVGTWKVLGFPLGLLPLSHHLWNRKGKKTLSSTSQFILSLHELGFTDSLRFFL